MVQRESKYLKDGDAWMLGEHIPDCDIYFFQVPASCFANDSSYPFIKKFKKFLGCYKEFFLDFYIGQNDSNDVAESILKALVERPGFANDLDKNIIAWSDKLVKFSKNVAKLPLGTYSNKKLWSLYDTNDKIHTKLYTYGWLPVAVDIFHNNFTRKLKSYLYSICDSKDEAEKAFLVLTTPSKKTIVAKEREEFLYLFDKYTKEISQKKLSPPLIQDLDKHARKWGHMGYIYAGNVEPFDSTHYFKELIEIQETGLSARAILKAESRRLGEAQRKQKYLYKKLGISPLYKRLFEAAKDFALSKLVRRHSQLFNLQILHNSLLSEIAKRLELSRYQVQFMLKDEIKRALLTGFVARQELAKRLKLCVMYTEKGVEQVFTGSKAVKLIKLVEEKIDKNINEITGQVAQPGYAKGVAKIVIRAKDMPKMNKGDILISIATDVDVVPAMKKAAAIVTEQGGITSHAAIVSRELGTPCIIGTKVATEIFKDGDLVEVDANKGIVRKLS